MKRAFCSRCQFELDYTWDHDGDLIIEPCEHCLDAASDDGYDIGREDARVEREES